MIYFSAGANAAFFVENARAAAGADESASKQQFSKCGSLR
jgi:hypothetical protein